jgi:hypothetical protein
MDAATHHAHLESLVLAAGMTAFADDCDRIVIRRAMPSQVQATFVQDSDFGPLPFDQ